MTSHKITRGILCGSFCKRAHTNYMYFIYFIKFSLGYLHVLYIKSTFNATTSELTLRCGVQGYPSPNVWWTKDGSFLNGTNISFKNDNKTLVVMDPQPRDNGTYYCHARNILTYVNRSLTLNLICKS